MIKNQNISLIIECCKEEKDLKLIEEKIKFIDNWSEFISLSYIHGVFPLVYNCLKKYDCLIPKEFFTSMKSTYLDIVKSNMFMTNELLNILEILKENNIKAIPFKGPILSQMVYGDVVSRQYVDLDILFDKKDITKLQNLINKLKFKKNLQLTIEQEKIWINYAHDISYKTLNNINIEFHWRMLDFNHPINLNQIDFLNSIDSFKFNGVSLNKIKNEESLIYLCVHGTKHLYERVEWIVDIDKYIRKQKIDWEIIDKLIENDNSKRFFYLGLYLSNYLFNTPLDKNITKNFDNNIKKTSKYILSNWNKQLKFQNKNNLKYMLKLFLTYKDKLKYINKIYFKPTFSEYSYLSFPKYLNFLYYPLRQYLLIKKYFIKS